ncbi:MAG TPA: thiolase domain-containing protein [Pseudonocardiaceae bacterium]|nr:thiolase domain-containing protein [Pseudonocardiaceae bacterium]
MTEVAVVGFAQEPHFPSRDTTTNGVEMLVPLFRQVFADTGLTKSDIGFWCSGSSDYLAGRAFSFIAAVDAIGAFPPINESHVEMDAAWALYEAWVKIKTGEVDTALVYGFGKSSAGQLRRVLAMQLDPYTATPLWPDSVSVAGLQARAGLDAGRFTEKDMAEVVARTTGKPVKELLGQPYFADPLRKHDCAPVSDGAATIILASAERARDLCERPAYIAGIDHRIDSPNLGERDLTEVATARISAKRLGVDGVEAAELHAPFSHQEILLRQAIGLPGEVRINSSGGALAGNPMFAAGLSRIGEAAKQVMSGEARRVLAHATSGPALQQNLLCVLEGQ